MSNSVKRTLIVLFAFLMYASSLGNYINLGHNSLPFGYATIDLAITSIVMIFVPLTCRLVYREKIEYKKGKKICKWNSIILFIISLIIIAMFKIGFVGGLGAILYYFINKWIFVYNENDCDKKLNLIEKDEKKSCKKNHDSIVLNKKILKANRKVILCVLIALVLFETLIYFFSNKTIEEVKDSVVKVYVYDINGEVQATGSGFCAYNKNYIVTNFHVIEGAYEIKIETDEGKYYDADNILVFQKNIDLAILYTDASLSPLKINTNKIQAGQKVIAIGSPKGMLNTVSEGVVSNADNSDYVRFTAPISPGSSGGVLLDSRNRVIGITTATYNSIDAQNINFARSSEYLENLYVTIKNKQYITVTDTWLEENANIGNELSDKTFTDRYTDSNKQYSAKVYQLYKMTNGQAIFNSVMEEWTGETIDTYKKMTDKEKEKVYLYFKDLVELYDEQFNTDDIDDWDNIKWILNITDIQKYELAMALVTIKDADEEDYFDVVNGLNLDVEEKVMFNMKICGYTFEWLHDDDKKALFDYIGEKFDYDAGIKILRKLGYRIVENDEGYTGYW